MKQRKKIKRETFSDAPRHLNRRKRAEYEAKKRAAIADAAMLARIHY